MLTLSWLTFYVHVVFPLGLSNVDCGDDVLHSIKKSLICFCPSRLFFFWFDDDGMKMVYEKTCTGIGTTISTCMIELFESYRLKFHDAHKFSHPEEIYLEWAHFVTKCDLTIISWRTFFSQPKHPYTFSLYNCRYFVIIMIPSTHPMRVVSTTRLNKLLLRSGLESGKFSR